MSILNDRNAKIMALPNVPQAIPLLTQLAQRPDPSNPMQQTLALMKLNEIKRMQSAMQSAQAPQGTVKDQTVQQVAQNTGGVAQLQGARLQQGMQQMAQAAGAQGPAPAGTGEPVQAAKGGLMSLPVKRYAAGQLVQPGDADRVMIYQQEMAKLLAARQNPNYTPEQKQRVEADIAALSREMSRIGISPRSVGTLAGTGAAMRAAEPPTQAPAQTPEAAGIASVAPAANYERELYDVARKKQEPADRSAEQAAREQVYRQIEATRTAEAGREAERKQTYEQDKEAKSTEAVARALMAAGEATRGKRGLGSLAAALGGYGSSVIGAREGERSQRDAMLKDMETRQQAQAELQKAEYELRLAHASGDANRIAKAEEEYSKRKQDALEKLVDVQKAREQMASTERVAATQAGARLASSGSADDDYSKKYDRAVDNAQKRIDALVKTAQGTLLTAKQIEDIQAQYVVQEMKKLGLPVPDDLKSDRAPAAASPNASKWGKAEVVNP